MFGKRGFEGNKASSEELMSVEKAARILSVNEKMRDLVNRFSQLQLDGIKADEALLDDAARDIRGVIKAKNITLSGVSQENNADIKAFVESFELALTQNTGRCE